jgi:hypothetical protein
MRRRLVEGVTPVLLTPAPVAATPVAAYTFELTRDGDTLRGTSMGPNNLLVKVEFTRERR